MGSDGRLKRADSSARAERTFCPPVHGTAPRVRTKDRVPADGCRERRERPSANPVSDASAGHRACKHRN